MRLDEARDISRYLTGLLVFLGLLGTFWGLIETVGSVGAVIQTEGRRRRRHRVRCAKEGLAAPLAGMGISFSSSLFGLAGSLVLGFLDLQASQAQNRFYTELEDWLPPRCDDHRRSTEPAAAARAAARCASRSSGCATPSDAGRRRQGDDGRDGQPRRGDPGPGSTCAPSSR